MSKRRKFLKNTLVSSIAISSFPISAFNIIHKPNLENEIIGHGDFTYRIEREWGNLDPTKTPVNNCHEMVMDAKKRLILLTDHPKNNIIIYDKAGKLLSSWTLNFKGAHGLTLHNEGDEEFLFITDVSSGTVVKTDLKGRIIMTVPNPRENGVYNTCDAYRPTETAIGPNGDIYIADGYGSQFILQYDMKGNPIRKFGGDSFLQKDKFKQVHGVTIDNRDKNNPTLLCTGRIKNMFKRFSLEGEYIEDIYIPGAFLSRAVIDGDNLYSGVCFGMTKSNYNMQKNLGFITILNKENRVVSNPGGTAPSYHNGHLQTIYQEKAIFKHCHDVCIDDDKNLYVCQWNADKVYPYKLHRL